MRAVTALALVVTLAACSSGYDRAALEKELAAARAAYPSNRVTTKELATRKPAKELPARIAIVPPSGGSLRWSQEEGALFEHWAQGKEKIAKSVLVLRSALVTPCADWRDECRLEQACTAALRAQTDAVLVLHVVSDTDEHVDMKGLWYLSVVGMWFAEGSHLDALTIVDGVLIDAKTEYLHAFARGEGEAKQTSTLVAADKENVLALSRAKALKNFLEELEKSAKELKARASD